MVALIKEGARNLFLIKIHSPKTNRINCFFNSILYYWLLLHIKFLQQHAKLLLLFIPYSYTYVY
jgi:hypothetical protein